MRCLVAPTGIPGGCSSLRTGEELYMSKYHDITMKGGILTICYYDIDVDIDINNHALSQNTMRKYLTHQTIQECQFAKYHETLTSRIQDIYVPKSRIACRSSLSSPAAAIPPEDR